MHYPTSLFSICNILNRLLIRHTFFYSFIIFHIWVLKYIHSILYLVDSGLRLDYFLIKNITFFLYYQKKELGKICLRAWLYVRGNKPSENLYREIQEIHLNININKFKFNYTIYISIASEFIEISQSLRIFNISRDYSDFTINSFI